jgi:uncharacterized protein (TIGR03000 family)
MTRYLISAAVLAAIPAFAPAQTPVSTASGYGSFGPGTRPGTPSLAAPNTSNFVQRPFNPRFRTGFAAFGPGLATYNPLFGGGYFAYPYAYPYFGYAEYAVPVPVPVLVPVPVPVPVPVVPPAPIQNTVVLGDEYPAVLTLEFPAAATVWVGGEKQPGDPTTEHVLTSQVLKPGQTHTFDVKAQWKVDDKAYQYERKVTLKPGDRTRSLVMAGTAVK